MAPIAINPVPVAVNPAPVAVNPAPNAVNPAPIAVNPAPIAVKPAPIAINSVPMPSAALQTSALTVKNDGPMSPLLSPTDSLRMTKRNVLQQSTTKTSSIVRSRFERTTSVAFDSRGSVHDFLKMLKNERFRYMPHDGSNWDKVLKWADNIGGVVLLSDGILDNFMINSDDATRLICDSCTGLIQLGTEHIKVLLKVFSVFHKMAFALSVFLRQDHLIKSNSDVRRELAHAYQEFAHLTRDVYEYCVSRSRRSNYIDLNDFDSYISHGSASFYAHLGSVSISMWTSGKHCSHFKIHEIRDFLSPQDSVVRTIMSNQLYSEMRRAEYTCEWFAPHLRSFTRSSRKVFLITGAAYSGKTVLARWIHEKLQESIDNEPYDVISYSVDPNVKYTTNPLSLIKSLLLQLLDRKIGRESLLTQITKAIDIANQGGSLAEVETTLWSALEASLDDKKIMIVIDGLDQLAGAKIGNPLTLEVLNRITKAKQNVKAIVLCRPVSESALKQSQESLVLEDVQKTTGDIEHYVQDFIQHRSELRRLKEGDKQSIVQKYTEAAKGSFLWLELQLQSVKHEVSVSAILKACQNAHKTVDESLDHLIANLNTKRPETKHILSWILAAERPLAVKEVKSLLEIDLDGSNADYRMFSGDIEKTIVQSCGSLVVIRDGLVHLRYPSIRERLTSTASAAHKSTKLVIDLKEAHQELTLRCLAHVKIQPQNDDIEPQADLYDAREIALAFKKHHLFEYATRYWIIHFRASALFDNNTGELHLSALFKNAFPSTVRMALFEGSCLARQYIAIEGEKLQHLAYNIRKTLLGEHTTAVLQSVLLELRICRSFKSASVLSDYAYAAWKISHRSGCSVSVVQALAEAFIEYSVTLSVIEHSDVCFRKEEILEYLIESYQHEHNESKEVHYLKMLAELYIDILNVRKAVVIYFRLYRLRLQVSGHLHEETHTLFELLVKYLKVLSLHEEVLEITLEYYEYLEQTLAITDERRVNITITVIELYEERNEVYRAEEILVRFWNSVSVSTTKTTRITELKVDLALKYSSFLYRNSRKEESEVILRGIWTEIQTYSYEARFESTMIKRIQKIAKYFESLEIFTMSRSIYQSLYEHYESREERTSTECISIVRSLSETITKSISRSKATSTSTSTSTSTTSTSTTTVISKEESRTLLEVFESSLESTEISSTTISICKALCSSYMYEEKYEEACEIYRRVIKKVWASIETTTVEVSVEITERLTEEIFELCINLAICHFKMLHIEIAASIYINLFRALIITRHIENKHFLLAKIKIIIAFFQEIYQYERIIEIYRELFIWMPICFGKTHRETIVILIEFARICFRLRLYQEASTACFYIYSCFHTSDGCLHYDGFAAAFLLCEIYEIQGKWELAYEVYGYLWRTFVRFGFEYNLDVKIVEKIFSRYLFILEHKETVEYSVLLEVSKEYYESCIKFYKHSHEITIKATLEYAHICERHEEHHETSISLYKEVIKYCKETESEFSKTTLRKTETRIAKLYSLSTKEITKAVSIYSEQYESSRKTESSSKETITALHNLVSTYKKQSTTESITKATSTLKTSVLEIFQSESHSQKLIESAQSIAKIYKECSFTEQATTLIQEMRSKVVEEVRTSFSSSTKTEKKSYVFLASFQEAFTESSSFSSVMAELRTEMLMYESYFKATSTTKTTTIDYRSVIQSGSSLYFHLEKKSERRSEFIKIEKELTEYFFKYLNFSRTVKESVLHYFFELYLKQSTKIEYEHEVVKQASEAVLRFTKTSKFAEAYDLVLLIERFIHLDGGFQSEFYIRTGFNLSKYLVGIDTHKCGDAKLYAAMLDLSRTILQEALKGLDKIDIELVELQQLLADLVSTLSEQKKYEDLERILQTLWHTRTIRNNMSSSPLVLYIGRSLVQTLACLNKFSDAIHLCYHIRYNLAYIRGALDKSTLDFTILLSELYTEQKRYKDAMELHEDILCRLGEGQTAPGLDALKAVHTHTELLQLAFKRAGKFDKSPQHYYDVFATLDECFGHEKAWTEKRPQPEKWTAGTKEGETFGCWKKPAKFEWEFEGEESVGETRWREELVKRRVSGKSWFGGAKAIEAQKEDDYFGKGFGKAQSNGHANGNGYGNGHVHATNGNASKAGLV